MTFNPLPTEPAPFADMPDDLEFDRNAAPTVITDEIASQRYTDKCSKCKGTGRFVGWSGRSLGACFKCGGAGKLEFKTSPEQRAKARQGAADRKARDEQAKNIARSNSIKAWREANPEDAAWIDRKDGTFDFATSMSNALAQWGTLTPGQHAAVTRLRIADAEREVARAAERAAAQAAAPVVTATKLEDAFAAALNAGLKYPKINLGGLVFKPAKSTGKNPGAIYVTDGGAYLGKVLGGRFLRVRECGDEQQARVVDFVNDPKAAAQAYGIETGVCCICSRELTDPVSVANGIGPICAGRFGW